MEKSQLANPNWGRKVPWNTKLRHVRWLRPFVKTDPQDRKQGSESKNRLRRVSQRPGQAYSRMKQVIAVTRGINQIDWNLNQKILVFKPTDAYSIPEPAAHNAANRQAMMNGRAAGIRRLRQA